MSQTYRVNLRMSQELVLDLKIISMRTHEGKYQTLIKDILKDYVRSYKENRSVAEVVKDE